MARQHTGRDQAVMSHSVKVATRIRAGVFIRSMKFIPKKSSVPRESLTWARRDLTAPEPTFTLFYVRRAPVLAAFITLMVSAAVPGSALLSCMADENHSAMAQMACCKTAKPECEHASQAMQCCKSGDHPDQQNLVKAPPLIKPLKMSSLASAIVPVVHTAAFLTAGISHTPVTLFAGTTSPPRFVFSTLLI